MNPDNGRINHFVYGEFKPQPCRLLSTEVGRFYDNFVPVSVDVMPVITTGTEKKILLGLRRDPKIWWTIGRGMVPGESPAETAIRALREEFGIDTDSNRFKFICINSSVFDRRRQPPEENGRHCLTVVFSLEIRPDEIDYFSLKNEKYQKLRWFPISKINYVDFNSTIMATVAYL